MSRKVYGRHGKTIYLQPGQFYCDSCDSIWNMTIWEKGQLESGKPSVHKCDQCGNKIKLFLKWI